MLQTPQRFPRAGSQSYPTPSATADADGSTTITIGPERPAGSPEGNWIQTTEGKGWFLILRLYSPLAPYFDKSWRPSEIEVLTYPSSQRKEGTMAAPGSETPVLDLLASMTADSVAASSLDAQTLMLVRIAALVAVDAPPSSYLLNLGAAADSGLDAEQVRGVLTAVAPIVGAPRVASATGSIVEALAVAIEVAELEAEAEE